MCAPWSRAGLFSVVTISQSVPNWSKQGATASSGVKQVTRKLTDILAVQEEISAEISDALKFKLTGEERKRLARRYTQNAEAYQLYLRGRFHWNKKTTPGFLKGIEYFEQAIEADPNYAPAYAALAALYNNLANYNFGVVRPKEAWAKAKAAAERAIEIDDNLASAHASLALVAYQWEWDWVKAESEFKRSLALDSNSTSTFEPSPSSTHHWYSHYLMTVGRVDESLSAGRRALDLEPLDLANNSHQGWHFLFTRQYRRMRSSRCGRRSISIPTSSLDGGISAWYTNSREPSRTRSRSSPNASASPDSDHQWSHSSATPMPWPTVGARRGRFSSS